MTRLVLAPRALFDMERLTDFLLESDPESAVETGQVLIDGLAILKDHPLVGRPVKDEYRELVISRGRSGYLAVYRYDVLEDMAVVLAVRHQRENSPSDR